MTDSVAYKILTADQWASLDSIGSFAGSPDDLRDGFIHMSTPTQLADTAAKHFADQDDLVLATVDLTAIEDLRWEPARGGALFPHSYGPLPRAAIRDRWPLLLGADGQHIFPPELFGGGY